MKYLFFIVSIITLTAYPICFLNAQVTADSQVTQHPNNNANNGKVKIKAIGGEAIRFSLFRYNPSSSTYERVATQDYPNGATEHTFMGLPPGKYLGYIQEQNEEEDITIPFFLLGIITTIDGACNSNTGDIQINVVGGNVDSEIDYNWSNGENGNQINNLVSGDYSVSVTVSDDDASTTVQEMYYVSNSCNIPTLSQWGLIILGLLTLIIGIVSIRQEEKATA